MRMFPGLASNWPHTVMLWRMWTLREKGRAFTTTDAIQVRGTLWKK